MQFARDLFDTFSLRCYMHRTWTYVADGGSAADKRDAAMSLLIESSACGRHFNGNAEECARVMGSR